MLFYSGTSWLIRTLEASSWKMKISTINIIDKEERSFYMDYKCFLAYVCIKKTDFKYNTCATAKIIKF
jgi:hypothetical protein